MAANCVELLTANSACSEGTSISTSSACSAATSALGLTWVQAYSSAQWPFGCYVFRGDTEVSVYFKFDDATRTYARSSR